MNTAGAADAFFEARDFLLKYRTDYDTAVRAFQWPARQHFNWALDYFDTIASGNDRPALHIVDEDVPKRSVRSRSCRLHRIASRTSCATWAHGRVTACC